LQPGNYTVQLIFNDQQVLTKQLNIQWKNSGKNIPYDVKNPEL
jgi:hypothetical protein